MTKIIAYSALHYGRTYLDAAIRSVIDAVDEYHVLYSANGSHGTRSAIPCPDNEADLHDIAWSAAGTKLRWHEGTWSHEGQQRDSIMQYAGDADVIVTLDYDEIWQPHLVEKAIDIALAGEIKYWRVPFRHYWRSFYRCILHDPAYPVRIIKPNGIAATETLPTKMAINHFGYAIPPEMMDYKWRIHGHIAEKRRDVDWFNDVFMANRQTDTHPVGSEHWQPEEVDPFEYGWLPEWMMEHPYALMEVIK